MIPVRPKGGDNGKTGADQGGHVEGGLGNTNHRSPGQLPGCQQARVTKAGDNIGIDGILALLTGQYFLDNTHRADGFIKMAFDGNRAVCRLGGGNACARRYHLFCGRADGAGHGAGGVRVDDSDMHGFSVHGYLWTKQSVIVHNVERSAGRSQVFVEQKIVKCPGFQLQIQSLWPAGGALGAALL